MWRVSLSLLTHRFFLTVVALCAINFHVFDTEKKQVQLSIQPLPTLWEQFIQKASNTPEATELKQFSGQSFLQIVSQKKDPFIWLGKIFGELLGLPSGITVLILSNIFLFLFLAELYAMVNLMALPDVAVDTCILAILWLTSYELSFGSTLSLSCFLSVYVLRHGMDNRWLLAGLALGVLAVNKPFAIFLIPLLLLIFWNQQRHFAMAEISRRALYLIIPVGLAVFFNWSLYENSPAIIYDSAFFNLLAAAQQQQNFTWAVSQTYLGQSIAILILLIGTVASFFIFSTFLHRVLPLFLLIALLLSTPYRDIATYTLLAAPAFSGIAEGSASGVLKTVQGCFLIFGALEVFKIFS